MGCTSSCAQDRNPQIRHAQDYTGKRKIFVSHAQQHPSPIYWYRSSRRLRRATSKFNPFWPRWTRPSLMCENAQQFSGTSNAIIPYSSLSRVACRSLSTTGRTTGQLLWRKSYTLVRFEPLLQQVSWWTSIHVCPSWFAARRTCLQKQHGDTETA